MTIDNDACNEPLMVKQELYIYLTIHCQVIVTNQEKSLLHWSQSFFLFNFLLLHVDDWHI